MSDVAIWRGVPLEPSDPSDGGCEAIPVLRSTGWRIFLYADENDEMPHLRCEKDGREAEFRLLIDSFDIEEEFSYLLKPVDRSFLRQTLFSHFDYLAREWKALSAGDNDPAGSMEREGQFAKRPRA
jgi:hypothetical protein